MTSINSFQSESISIATHGGTINGSIFGGIYTAFSRIDSFEHYIAKMGLTMIRWPGGTLAEQDQGRYSQSFADLFNPDLNRPGLSDMLALCNEKSLGFEMIIPTASYVGRPAALRADVRNFATKLASGGFGEVPDDFTLDIGNEYYAQSVFRGKPALFGKIANIIIEELMAVLGDANLNTLGIDPNIAMQVGVTVAEDAAIRAQLSAVSLLAIDELRTHRLVGESSRAGSAIERLNETLDNWHDDQIEVGGSGDYDLNLSAWATMNWVRNEAVRDYARLYERHFGSAIDIASIDESGRTDVAFEQFWQRGVLIGPGGEVVQTSHGLSALDYGSRTVLNYLQVLTQYADIGLDRASIYGIDVAGTTTGSTPNRLQGDLVGTEFFAMMSESLPGLSHVILPGETYRPAGQSDHVNVFAFEDDEQIVVFLAANDINDRTGLTYDFSGMALAGNVVAAWGERLYGETPSDWMALFGIQDNPNVDESPEAMRYQVGYRETFIPQISGNSAQVTFTHDYEVIRLVLARTPEAVAAIQEWAGDIANYVYPGSNPAEARTLTGTVGIDRLDGGSGDDVLNARMGNDTLNGGRGADRMSGGAGDDLYLVDTPYDVVMEGDRQGWDTVRANVSYVLPSHVEVLRLSGLNDIRGTGNALGNLMVGNSGDNQIMGLRGQDTLLGGAGKDTLLGGIGNDSLFGGAGHDVLDGGMGRDLMRGGAGNDTYVVDHVGDRIVELEGQGLDSVLSLVSYTLPPNVERLLFGGTGDSSGIGNGGNNRIEGNNGNNFLTGAGGNDTLLGGLGNDTLHGGAGADRMTGGAGNDLYIVDNAGDRVTELAGGGTDTVRSVISWALSPDVENLVLVGTAAISGTGNSLSNTITGNDNANLISGWAGNDILRGGLGNDSLFGGNGNDRLDGGAGNDVLTGGPGADTFVFATGFGRDIVRDFDPRVAGEVIDLSGDGRVNSFHQLKASFMRDAGHDTIIDFGSGDTIVIQDVSIAQLSANDFLF